jgi:hypothetical protein
MQLGIYPFAETAADPSRGRRVDTHERLRFLMEEIKRADQVDLDVFGLGERRRSDFAVSAPAVVLAAARSKRRKSGRPAR